MSPQGSSKVVIGVLGGIVRYVQGYGYMIEKNSISVVGATLR